VIVDVSLKLVDLCPKKVYFTVNKKLYVHIELEKIHNQSKFYYPEPENVECFLILHSQTS